MQILVIIIAWVIGYVMGRFDGVSAANKQEVKHAKFVVEDVKENDRRGIGIHQPYSCSNCHKALSGTELFCPNCGAKME